MIKRAFGRFGNSGFSYLPFKVVEGAVGMAELAIYTRLFGKAVFGEYSVANASVTLIAILAITWLRFVGTRYISEFKKKRRGAGKISFYSVFFLCGIRFSWRRGSCNYSGCRRRQRSMVAFIFALFLWVYDKSAARRAFAI